MATSPAMKSTPKNSSVTRWVNYGLIAVWVVLLVFLAQNAMASQTELEPRASMVFWVSFVVVLIAGAIIAAMRGLRRPTR